MSEMDKSLELRLRTLSKAKVPRSLAINSKAPLHLHQSKMLSFYGLDKSSFFRDHLDRLEQSGRAEAFASVDIVDRVAVSDPGPGQVKVVQVVPQGPRKAPPENRFYKNEEGLDAP